MIDCSKCSSGNTKLDHDSLEITCNDCGETHTLRGAEKLKIFMERFRLEFENLRNYTEILKAENKQIREDITRYHDRLDTHLHTTSVKDDKANKYLAEIVKLLVDISIKIRDYYNRKPTKLKILLVFLGFLIPILVTLFTAFWSPTTSSQETLNIESDYNQLSIGIPDDPHGYALAIWNARYDMNELIILVNDSNRPLSPYAMSHLIIQGNININDVLINNNNTQILTSDHIRQLITRTNLPLLTRGGIAVGTTNTFRNLVYKMNNAEMSPTDMYAIANRANNDEIMHTGMYGEGIVLLVLQSRDITLTSFMLVMSANNYATLNCQLAQRFIYDALNRAFDSREFRDMIESRARWFETDEYNMGRFEILEHMRINYGFFTQQGVEHHIYRTHRLTREIGSLIRDFRYNPYRISTQILRVQSMQSWWILCTSGSYKNLPRGVRPICNEAYMVLLRYGVQ